MSKAATSLIQTGLRDLGYEPGPIDGVFGGLTRAAAQSWLDAAGMPSNAAQPVETSSVLYQGSARHPVHEVVIHCSATRLEWMEGDGLAAQVGEIREWHVRDRGWRDIGYHWVIGRDGKILPGRAETEIGAGVAGHNQGVIHVCLIGGFGSAETDLFKDHFTLSQDLSLRQLLLGIGMRTQIRLVTGHNQYAAKACPGFNVTNWLTNKEAA